MSLETKRDVFDHFMELKPLEFALPFYRKHKKALLYVFFGILTTLVSIGSFAFFYNLGLNEHFANIVSWVLAVAFAFWTNRTWVFSGARSQGTESKGSFFKEILGFFSGRVLTLGIEEVLLLIFISFFGLPAVFVKVSAQVIVLVLNYFVSKLVFHQKGSSEI